MAWSRSAKIIFLLILDTAFFLIELITGYAVGSLALIADSFHMLNDIISLVIALYAIKLTSGSSSSSDPRYSYGWHRAEILAALVNGVFLLALCVSILLEAISRFFTVPEIDNPKLVTIVGAWGLVSNIIGLALFHGRSSSLPLPPLLMSLNPSEHDHDHESSHRLTTEPSASTSGEYLISGDVDDTTPLLQAQSAVERQVSPKKTRSMNMHALLLHVIGDALGNVGVIATGLVIWKTNWEYKFYFDPFISLVITMIIFSTALPLVKKTSFILLQGVPATVSMEEVTNAILHVDGVLSVHELHVWQLSESKLVASVHVLASSQDFMPVAMNIRKVLHHLGIHSCTIQPEYSPNTAVSDLDNMSRDKACLVLCPPDQSCDPRNACCRECDDIDDPSLI
ncbi:cation efflux protein [Gymnopilus junonius]|uniref:Cation efflux protein n=1 Tax=Gymnopilus junonius TaxID=109634 RepID=A0A9P5THC0_GYMJU|nr:cation efflux protein [Gymnopilus junonius]